MLHFNFRPHCFRGFITGDTRVEVGISSKGDEAVDVVGRRRLDVRKAEGFKLGAFSCTHPGDGGEPAGDGLDEWRAVSEGREKKYMREVVPSLLAV